LKKKIGIVSLGCPKNLIDTEIMLGLLKDDGFEITADESAAHIIIVNTCGFIESAKEESINAILEMAEYKKSSCELLIVTGCLAERYNKEIIEQISEVDAVTGTGHYGEIISVISLAYEGHKPLLYGDLNEISYLENERLLSSDKGSAYLKIAEGCDNHCTFCIIPQLRGKYRSRKIEAILAEAEQLAEKGVKEIILIAQDTTKYGFDLFGEYKLTFLIREISKIDKIKWIRLLYCYPENVNDELIDEFAVNDKLVKYIDLPIQHFSDKILKSMGRKESEKSIGELIHKLRANVPGIVLRTTLITGFPGEDENDQSIMLRNITLLKFDRLGVFVYSKEEGTPAAKLKPHVSKSVKKQRFDELMSAQSKIAFALNEERIGKEYIVLTEGIADDGLFYFGRSYAESPNIDPEIYYTSRIPLEIGSFATVKIIDSCDYDLTGEAVNESSE